MIHSAKVALEILWPRLRRDFARGWWDLLSLRERLHLLWDLPLADRPLAFEQALDRAAVACAGYVDGFPVAVAWIQGWGDTNCGSVHFSMTRAARPYKEAFGRMMLTLAGDAAGYCSLVCLVPWPWKWERFFIRSLGFGEGWRLGEACRLAERGRLVDGGLYHIRLKGAANVEH